MSPITTFSNNTTNATICISIEEFEHLQQCKKELLQIKEELKLFLGDDL